MTPLSSIRTYHLSDTVLSTNPFCSNLEKVAKIVGTLNLKIPPRELKTKDTRHLLSLIFSQWLSLSTCIIQSIIDIVPAPAVAQATRIPRMIYPDLYEQTINPKNKLEEDLFTSNSSSSACVSAYVSKTFAVSVKDLPENKKKPFSAEELRENVRKARITAGNPQDESSPLANSVVEHPPAETLNGAKEETEEPEVILGLARLYAGTIRVGAKVYCVLPKYRPSLGPVHPQNGKYLAVAQVEGLYVMMGRELVPVDFVRAGNTFAIKGLEGRVWRSATLCAPGEAGIGDKPDIHTLVNYLINLGGLDRPVRILLRLLFVLLAQEIIQLRLPRLSESQ